MIRGRWFLVAAAIFAWFVALAAWVSEDPRMSLSVYGPFSSYNTGPGGLSQAFGYLAARRGGVRRLMRDVALERPRHDATILRVGSPPIPIIDIKNVEEKKPQPEKSAKSKKPAKKEGKKPEIKDVAGLLDDGEEAWVRSGGRLVIAPSSAFASLRLDARGCSVYRQVFPIDPPLPAIDVPNCHSFSGAGLQRFHSLVVNDAGPVIARRPLGAGEIILFSIPEAFSNEYLGRGGNLALLERLAGSGPVYVDETIHGIVEESSIWDLLVTEWRLGPALILLFGAAVAGFWRRARATGLPERDEIDVRSDAVDLVQSLGQLYDRAVDREESLRLYYHALVRAVHARSGLTGEPLEKLVRQRTQGYDPRPRFQDITREEFQRMLKILNHAYETVGYANTR